jgi:hypothetical protein
MIGRKATSEDPEERKQTLDPSSYMNGSSLLQLGVGAGIGGALGRYAHGPSAPKQVDTTPMTVEDVLNKGRWKSEDIAAAARRADALGDSEVAKGLRVAAQNTGKSNAQMYDDGTRAITNAGKAVEKGWQQEARNLNSREKYLAGVAKETDKAKLQTERQSMKDWMQEARNLNKAEEYNRAQANAEAVERRLAELEGAGATPQTIVTKTSKMEGPEGTVKATTVIKPSKGEEGEEPPAVPSGSAKPAPKGPAGPALPAPKEGIWQIVDSKGNIVANVDNEQTTLELIEKAGPKSGYKVVAPPPTTASTILAPVGGHGEATPEGGAVPPPFNPPRLQPTSPLRKEIAEHTIEEAAKLRGTPADVPNNPKAQQLEAERQAELEKYKQEQAAAAAKAAPVEPAAPEKPDLIASGLPTVKEAMKSPKGRAAKAKFAAEAARLKEEAAKMAADAKVRSQGIIPVVDSANLPTPEGPRIESAHPLTDITERVIVKNPMTGAVEPAPGDISTPAKTLILQPKKGGGWLRDVATPEGITHSETKAPALKGSKYENPPLTPEEQAGLEKEVAEGNYDPLTAEMLLRGRVPDRAPEPDVNIPQPSAQAPKEVLDRVAEFNQRREAAINAAQSPEEAQQIAAQFDDEANKLQLELSQAERQAELAQRVKGESGQIDPELAQMLLTRALPTAIGAGTGAAIDKKDRLRGALLGGAAGYGAGYGLSKMPTSFNNENAPNLLDKLVNYQRFSLLSNPVSLGVNTLAPTGGATMSSLEKILQGILGNKEMGQLGRSGLASALRPGRFTPSALKGDLDEAATLIANAEQSRADMQGAPQGIIDKIFGGPAVFMTAGDTGARNALQQGAGWSEDMARNATLTNEPRYAFGKGLVNLSRTGGPAARLMLPFVKTSANAVESSFERIPVMGLAAKLSSNNPELMASWNEIAARQGLGGLTGALAYQLGQHVDPETAKQYRIPYILGNMAGQYGPLAVAAFQAGQARSTGSTVPESVAAGGNRFFRDLPLPTTEVLGEMVNALKNIGNGLPVHPDAPNPIQRWLPDNMVPRLIKDRDTDSFFKPTRKP